MLRELLILAYCTAVGFVAAGLVSSLYQLFTHRPVAFALPDGRITAHVLAAMSFAVIGPYIVSRNAIRAWFVDRRPVTWLLGGFAIALIWSACSGIVVLDLVLAVRQSLG